MRKTDSYVSVPKPMQWTGMGCDVCGFGTVEDCDRFDPHKPCPECGEVMEPSEKPWEIEAPELAPAEEPRWVAPQVVVVFWVDEPPESACQRINDAHVYDPIRGAHFIRWRDRWCVVADEAVGLFVRLDAWLREPDHIVEWSRG